jgi:putative peptide maturation dehydrogenase
MTKLRRCGVLMIEPREDVAFDLDDLLAGGAGIAVARTLVALAPHRDDPVPIDEDEMRALAAIPAGEWTPAVDARERHGAAAVDRLLAEGLLVSDAPEHAQRRARDEKLRARYWHSGAAVLHYLGRWAEVDAEKNVELAGLRRHVDLVAKFGPPPPAVPPPVAGRERIALEREPPHGVDALLRRRTTCRNYEDATPLPLRELASVLQTALAAHAVLDVGPGQHVLKKNTPSGGGLHPFEACLALQNVEGFADGLYRYDAVAHALDRVRAVDAPALRELATRFVAGQPYFANAHVQVALVARFERCFWKYRYHSKAYRVLALEAGTVAQTIYLRATELGLGAFVTAAINEVEIERAFGLDALDESPITVCGFGIRAKTRERVEFDPNREVWRD